MQLLEVVTGHSQFLSDFSILDLVPQAVPTQPVTGWLRIQLPDVIKTRLISRLMRATNAASRGGHRALAIPQSFLHTPSDANPACEIQVRFGAVDYKACGHGSG